MYIEERAWVNAEILLSNLLIYWKIRVNKNNLQVHKVHIPTNLRCIFSPGS